MKILFFNYEYPPLGGGAGNATFYLLQEFTKIPSLEIDLITSSIDKKFHLEIINDRVKIYKLPIGKNEKNLHFQSQKDLLVYTWKAFWFSRKLVKKNSYDVIHSFFTVPCGFLALIYHISHKIPYIISLRGADVPGYSERFSFIYGLLKHLIRFIWNRSFRVVANSHGLMELALKTKPDLDLQVIYNGVNIKEFYPKKSIQSKSFKLKIICVSRITARKGIKYLIKAIKKLVDKDFNIELKIIGEGNDKENLEKLTKNLNLEKYVEFLGMIKHEKLPEIYQQADLFILPSLNEGMSNTILEALASGLPIITTATGGTKELVHDGKNGFIIKMKNSNDIADKIEKLINNPELKQNMGIQSRIYAENFNWEKMAYKYFELYDEASKKI